LTVPSCGSNLGCPIAAPAREEWQITQALFKRFAAETRKNGSEFLLVVIPLSQYVYWDHVDDRPHRMIRQFGERAGIAVSTSYPPSRTRPGPLIRTYTIRSTVIGLLAQHFPWARQAVLQKREWRDNR